MPFISEEIYSIVYKRFKGIKSIHLEKWPGPYDNLYEELTMKGNLGVNIIKFLRMNKSKSQIPLNQELSKVIVLTEGTNIKLLDDLKDDIKSTIRIKDLVIMDKSKESSIKEIPNSEEIYEELNCKVYLFT